MSKDDMGVIVYKILKYLYECMKAGKEPEFSDICYDCKMYKIPASYWKHILYELIEAGYVRGFLSRRTKDGLVITMTDSASITMAGVHFLEENSRMKKAAEFLGEAFEIVVTAVVGAI